MQTSFVALDEILCGFCPGQLIILAGRPSKGKTALALNIADHLAMDEDIVKWFVNLAMSAMEIAEHLLAAAPASAPVLCGPRQLATRNAGDHPGLDRWPRPLIQCHLL